MLALIPVTIGNFIGGGIILPFAYYFIFLKKQK
jgi:formate/nitrite transporter FocA (FNT family)